MGKLTHMIIQATDNNNLVSNKEMQSAFKLSKSENVVPLSLIEMEKKSNNQSCSFKIEDILNTNSISKLYAKQNNAIFEQQMINKSKSSMSSSSSTSSSSSSYCSPISSISSPYSQQPSSLVPRQSCSSNESILNQFSINPLLNNPFINIANNNQNYYLNSIQTVNETDGCSFRDFSSALIGQINAQRQSLFSIDFLNSSAITNNSMKNDHYETTANKISMIDELAKQIDSLSESSKAQKKQFVEKKKHKQDSSKNSADDIKDECKKKKEKRIQFSCSGNCSDLACSSGLSDPSQLPMCLRGTSDEQLHLASLFNTLIHHKKCRRTRTVFSDMQLIGLEKRFENQKYLSTPDRIQLAEFLGLSQLQVKTWYQNRRMKWKKKVLKDGSHDAPTKPKGRPKKNSIPSFSDILKAAAANNSTGSSTESLMSSSLLKNSSLDENSNISSNEDDLSDDDENEEICYNYNNSSDSDDESTQMD